MFKNTSQYLFAGAILFVASIVSKPSYAESSVWQVSKGGDHIYIGGTVHILPPSEFPLPEEFNQAYQKSDAIFLETKLPDQNDSAFQMKMMQQVSYPNGKTIADAISTSTEKQLSTYLSGLGMQLPMVEKFKPGFLMTMFAMLEAQRAQLSGEGVDIFYSKQAKNDKKPIGYLESVEFQLDMIARLGEGDEDRFIKSNLKQMKGFKKQFSGLLSAWRAGDEEQLYQLGVKPMSDDPKTIKTLLTDRNQNWIPKIEAMFSRNGKNSETEFVLVGVAHLVGDKSVLSLLKAKGYKVEKL